VSVLERLAQLDADPDRLLRGLLSLFGEPPGEVAARHVLADDIGAPIVLADVVDGDDVGVVAETPDRLGLASHSCQSNCVKPLGLDDRDCHITVQPCVVGQIHALAPALAEELLNLVPAGSE
jgi:hypothetical protein